MNGDFEDNDVPNVGVDKKGNIAWQDNKSEAVHKKVLKNGKLRKLLNDEISMSSKICGQKCNSLLFREARQMTTSVGDYCLAHTCELPSLCSSNIDCKL